MTRVDVVLPTTRPAGRERALASVAAARRALGGALELEVLEQDGRGLGPAAARNRAVASGSAPYLALLDDDDRWHEPHLAEAVSLLRVRPELALVCAGGVSPTGEALVAGDRGRPGDRRHRVLALDCFVITSTVVLRRSDWEAAGGMDEGLRRAEDYDLWLRLTAGGRPLRLLAQAAVIQGREPGRLTDAEEAGVEATLEVLRRSACVSESDPAYRDRLGRLQAVRAHHLRRRGEGGASRRAALRALRDAPGAAVAWTAALSAVVGRR